MTMIMKNKLRRFMVDYIDLENDERKQKVVIAETREQAMQEAEKLGWVETLTELLVW